MRRRGRRTWSTVRRTRQPRIRPPQARSPRVRNGARPQGHDNEAAVARARRRSSHPETLARDWSRPLDEEAMTLERTVLTICQDSVGNDRRPSPVRGGLSVAGGGRTKAAQGAGRAPSVRGRGADTVLDLDSADGSVAAHRPTPDVPAHGTTHRRHPLGGRPEGRAARPGLKPLDARKKHVLTCGSQRRQTSRPVRRVLSPGRLAAAGETAIHLGPALLSASCGLPANSGGQPSNVRAGPSCDGPS